MLCVVHWPFYIIKIAVHSKNNPFCQSFGLWLLVTLFFIIVIGHMRERDICIYYSDFFNVLDLSFVGTGLGKISHLVKELFIKLFLVILYLNSRWRRYLINVNQKDASFVGMTKQSVLLSFILGRFSKWMLLPQPVILSPGILWKSCLIKMPGWRISSIISEDVRNMFNSTTRYCLIISTEKSVWVNKSTGRNTKKISCNYTGQLHIKKRILSINPGAFKVCI
jgi:hypothetical protein